jgi:serine/threonine-protein kinase
MSELELPDYAIGRFPVTLREYVAFLDALEAPEERRRRTPGYGEEGPVVEKVGGVWRITERCVEGEARKRVPIERELDLPVLEISWYDAAAYARWLARESGRPYRLPSDLEWEKSLRGADGRAFPMGNDLDPCFAKRRESRPEAVQVEPVGAFRLDESPYGVRDLAGGVGDWTSTFVDGGEAPAADAEGTAADERQAYWRGGTWSSTAPIAAMRYSQMLRHRVGWVGFRLAMSLDAEGSSSLEVRPMTKG